MSSSWLAICVLYDEYVPDVDWLPIGVPLLEEERERDCVGVLPLEAWSF